MLVPLVTLLCGHMLYADAAVTHFELTILHNNDMHGRFEETDEYTNQCKDIDKVQNKCFGGFARTATV